MPMDTDQAMSLSPAAKEHADGKDVRELAGKIADHYEAMATKGAKSMPGLVESLRVWETDGIEGVRGLIKQGNVPAAVLGLGLGLGTHGKT